MDAITICLLILGIVHGGLTILAGTMQLKQKDINLWPCLFMIMGGIMVITSTIFYYIARNQMFILLITGLIIIHIAAICNGFKMYGKLNPKHHIIRLGISFLIIILYMIKF